MEDTRFDDMAKAFGALTTRRLTLGALLGGALARLGLGAVNAKKSKGGGQGVGGQGIGVEAKSGKCKPACGTCQRCKKGKCRTKNGLKRCKKGTCQPLTGPLCTPTTGGPGTCHAGVCVPGAPQCVSGSTNCSGVCKNLQTDLGNCGACGHVCPGNHLCQGGSCCLASTSTAICGNNADCCSNDCHKDDPADLFATCH